MNSEQLIMKSIIDVIIISIKLNSAVKYFLCFFVIKINY